MNKGMFLWEIWADFFKSAPMYIFINIITIIGFLVTIKVFFKIKSINHSIKKLKKLECYQHEYEEFRDMLRKKNIPSDLYQRVERKNRLLYYNLGFLKSKKIKKQFKAIDKDDAKNYDGLKAFLNEVIIILEKDVA
jgi:cell shape-determining protein MreC